MTLYSCRRARIRRLVFLCIAVPWLIIMAIRIFPPVTFPDSAAAAALCIVPSVLWWLFASVIPGSREVQFAVHKPAMRRMLIMSWALFLFFVPLTYLNFFFLEGRSLMGIVEDRQLAINMGRQPSAAGGVIALLSASPVMLLCVRAISRESVRLRAVDAAIIAISVPTLLFSGGRNPLVLSVLFYYLTALFLRTVTGANSMRSGVISGSLRKLMALSFLMGMAAYVVLIAIQRGVAKGAITEYSDTLIRNYGLQVGAVYTYLDAISPEIAFAYTNFFYYITHSVDTLARIAVLPTAGACGFATFPLFTVVLDYSLGLNMTGVLESRLLFPGSYTTLWGALLQDGGIVLMILAVMLIGFMIWAVVQAKRFTPLTILLSAFLLLTIATAPIYALTSTGFGSSLLFVVFLIAVAARIRLAGPKRTRKYQE